MSQITTEELQSAIEKFSKLKILVVGDLMLDCFITGSVDRISPEAPVPVLHVSKEEFYPGGAANVARNLVPFADVVLACGVIGNDFAGEQLKSTLGEAGTSTDYFVELDHFPTIRKTRIVAQNQQIVRVDRESSIKLTLEDQEKLLSKIETALSQVDAVILEDYAKGLFDNQLVEKILTLTNKANTPIAVDPHPGNTLNWKGSTIVKPNRKEAFEVAGIKDLRPNGSPLEDENLLEVGKILLDRWETPHLLITLGAGGMMLFEPNKEPHHIPTRAQEVYDVSGAGDTAIAILTLGLASGLDAKESAEIANLASGIVVGKLGTASLQPNELIESLNLTS